MIKIQQVKLQPGHSKEQLYEKVAKELKINVSDIKKLEIVKKSIDARKKSEIWFSYVVEIKTANDETTVKRAKNPRATIEKKTVYCFPQKGNKGLKNRPVIVGAGPAGLFCGYFLAEQGYKPIIVERGKDVDARQRDVEEFWRTGVLNTESNVQFGEGGAGTFSDGKLNTLIKDKDGKGRKTLEVFVNNGAPEYILYENKPHIGTDILSVVVKNMRKAIENWGGEVHFQSQVTDVLLQDGSVCGVEINNKEVLACQVLVLAIGHSARNTFEMLHKKQIPMEAKSFAVGLRVEHPQKLINFSQYGVEESDVLPVAAYKLTAQTKVGRGVYSFCMCPGGYVVNASSEEERLAINGMSYSKRDGKNANSAIIVTVTPKDFASEHPLAGINFQRELEEKAYTLGKGKVPVQTYGEFKERVTGELCQNKGKMLEPCIKGPYTYADVSQILPSECNQAFVEGMEQFGRTIKGFNMPEALLSGVESRTSSPIRVHRDETGQSSIQGLYPCGEGAGYAGGIVSAAMDGISMAEKIAVIYSKPQE